MPSIKILDMSGKDTGAERELSAGIFDAEVNAAVLHSYVRAYLLNQRQGTQSALTRAEVRGGGRKPWRQKGTGRARQGSTRSPQWTHGGVAFAPKPRSYRVTINRKVKRVALKSALSAKVKGGEMIVVSDITVSEYKTKVIINMLKALGAEKKALIVVDSKEDKLVKSAANIPGVKTTTADNLNAYDILNCDRFIASSKAVDKIEEVYA